MNNIKEFYKQLKTPNSSVKDIEYLGEFNGDGTLIAGPDFIIDSDEYIIHNKNSDAITSIYQYVPDLSYTDSVGNIQNTVSFDVRTPSNTPSEVAYFVRRLTTLNNINYQNSMLVKTLNIGTYTPKQYKDDEYAYFNVESKILDAFSIVGVVYDGSDLLNDDSIDPNIEYDVSKSKYRIHFTNESVNEIQGHKRVSLLGLTQYNLEYVETTTPCMTFEMDRDSNKIKITTNEIIENITE